MEPEALVFSHDPALQLLIDVVSQREESRTAEATVVIDPPPQERINLSGYFSQRPWRLPGNAQGPDRRPHGFHRRRAGRRSVTTEKARLSQLRVRAGGNGCRIKAGVPKVSTTWRIAGAASPDRERRFSAAVAAAGRDRGAAGGVSGRRPARCIGS